MKLFYIRFKLILIFFFTTHYATKAAGFPEVHHNPAYWETTSPTLEPWKIRLKEDVLWYLKMHLAQWKSDAAISDLQYKKSDKKFQESFAVRELREEIYFLEALQRIIKALNDRQQNTFEPYTLNLIRLPRENDHDIHHEQQLKQLLGELIKSAQSRFGTSHTGFAVKQELFNVAESLIYDAKERLQEIKKREAEVMLFALGVGAVLTGVYLTAELVKWFRTPKTPHLETSLDKALDKQNI